MELRFFFFFFFQLTYKRLFYMEGLFAPQTYNSLIVGKATFVFSNIRISRARIYMGEAQYPLRSLNIFDLGISSNQLGMRNQYGPNTDGTAGP